MKNFKINSTYSISIEQLFDSIINPLQIIDRNRKKTFFGNIIYKSEDGGNEFYDLISPITGKLLCADGEECIIIDKQIDVYSLVCIYENSENNKFQLTQNELDISTFCSSQIDIVDFSTTPCIACNNCFYHSITGCQNMILKNEYISATESEKDFILNGEFCKYFIKK